MGEKYGGWIVLLGAGVIGWFVWKYFRDRAAAKAIVPDTSVFDSLPPGVFTGAESKGVVSAPSLAGTKFTATQTPWGVNIDEVHPQGWTPELAEIAAHGGQVPWSTTTLPVAPPPPPPPINPVSSYDSRGAPSRW